MFVRGVLQVHSAPPALCPHVEWAVAGALGVPVNLPWVAQAAAPGMVRAELDWQASPGTSTAITSALAGWSQLRFEVTEEASPGCDAVRYSYTPDLGVFSAVTMANGDILSREPAAVRWRPPQNGGGPPPDRGQRGGQIARCSALMTTRAVPVRWGRCPGSLAARHRLNLGNLPG